MKTEKMRQNLISDPSTVVNILKLFCTVPGGPKGTNLSFFKWNTLYVIALNCGG